MSREFYQVLQTENIIEEFKALQSATFESLRDQGVSSQLLLNNLPNLGINLSKLSDDETAAYVLNHSSFFNYHLIDFIIQSLGTKKVEGILYKYREIFIEYCRCDCLLEMNQFNDGIRDCLSEVSQSSGLATLLMIFTPRKRLTIGDLHLFFEGFRTKLNIQSSTVFNLSHIEATDQYNFKLTFQTPVSIACDIEVFVRSREQEMITMGIDHLCFICQFINKLKYTCQAKLENKGETSKLRPTDLKVLIRDAWEARIKWYELGLALECDYTDLDEIKANNHEVGDRFREMLKKRLSTGTTLQWSHLINALRQRHIHLPALANKLAETYEPGTIEQLSTCTEHDEADQSQLRNSRAMSIFSCEDTSKLDSDEDEFADSKHTTKQELKKVFFKLLQDIRERLNSNKVSPSTIVAHVTDFAWTFNEQRNLHQLLNAEDDQKELRSASSMDHVFMILSKYWTFNEHEMLVSIVERHGGRKIQTKMKKYQEKLKKFFENRRIEENLIFMSELYRDPDIIELKAPSTTDSGRGTTTYSTMADENDQDIMVDDDVQCEPYSRMIEVDSSKLLPSDHSENSLHQASLRGDLNEVKILVENLNYNPLQRDENGNTALHYAARGGQVDILRYFTQERKHSPASQNKVGLTPLHTAALCCCLEVIKYLTEEEKMELLDTDEEGFTPLHRACVGGDLIVVRYLVNKLEECGTKIEDIVYCKTNSGDNPIHYASHKGHLEVVKFFISELNCNPNIKGQWDKTPLQYAAQGGHLNTVKYLIEKEKCEYSSDNDTPFHLSVEYGHVHILKYLTTLIQFNPQSKNANGRTPLSSAALKGHLNVVKFITLDLKQHDPNIPDKDGKLPLIAATESGNLDIVRYFVEDLTCDPSQCMDTAEETPLHVAARKGHLEIVEYLTKKMSCSASSRNSKGDTPVNLAAFFGHHNVLEFLISELKCDPNTPGQLERTPLHYAAQEGYLDIVKFLIEDQKCNPSCYTGEDRVTPLHVAAKYGHLHVVKYLTEEQHCNPLCRTIKGENPLICSALNGHINVVEYLIRELKCDPNIPGPQNRTALHVAAERGHIDIVKYLIEACGCDSSSCDNDHKATPLHLAALGGHVNIVKYLTQDQRCSALAADKHPYIPLHYAAKFGHLEVVRYFIEECKCLPNVAGYREHTPLDLARDNGHNHIVKYLSGKLDTLHSTTMS